MDTASALIPGGPAFWHRSGTHATPLTQNAEHVRVVVGPDTETGTGLEALGALLQTGMRFGRRRIHYQRPRAAIAEVVIGVRIEIVHQHNLAKRVGCPLDHW